MQREWPRGVPSFPANIVKGQVQSVEGLWSGRERERFRVRDRVEQDRPWPQFRSWTFIAI